MPPIVYAPLAQTGLLRFSGADAQTFLQGQLSCDVAALQPLRATHGSYNTPKGRMLASFVLWRAGADYFMQLPHALCEPIRKRLSMYILRSKVQAADVSDKYALIGLLDAKAPGAIDLPATPMTLSETAGGWALRLDARRVEIIVPATQAAEIGELLEKEAKSTDESAWELAGIHAGIAVITPATQEEFVPQMANLDLIGGVSFSKGCYPGQEIVARTHYLGKLKQRMVLGHLETTTAPRPGDKLFSAELGEQAAGTVVNAAPADGDGFDVLAVVQTSTFSDNGLHFGSFTGPALQMRPLPYALEITELPKTKPA